MMKISNELKLDIKKFVREIYPHLDISDKKIERLLLNDDNKFIIKEENNKLQGISIINKDTIYFLAVKKEYRNRGIGTYLLNESEQFIKENGFKKIRVAHGKNSYFTPGIPSNKSDVDIKYKNIDLYEELDDSGHSFFKKHGYINSWGEDVFDMHMDLINCPDKYKVEDTINGIYYTIAQKSDLEEIINCVNDAEEEFTPFFNHDYYFDGDTSMILIAKDKEEIVGALIVGYEEDLSNGSIGCMSVKTNHRHLGIATNLSIIATKYLKDKNVKKGFLSYTHTGLDKLYGAAGYNICVFYFMAVKLLKN